MTIRDLCEADSWIIALCIYIRKGGTKLQKEYRIGAGVETSRYWRYIGESDKWIQYEEPGIHVEGCYGAKAISTRPINYRDTEGQSTCGVNIRAIPKRLLDLEIRSLHATKSIFYHTGPGYDGFYGYYIDAYLPEGMERWKDLTEEKVSESDSEGFEEYITEAPEQIQFGSENITFDDLLSGGNES